MAIYLNSVFRIYKIRIIFIYSCYYILFSDKLRLMSNIFLDVLAIQLFNNTGFKELLIRFSFNLLVIWFIVRYLYYDASRRKDYLFSYVMISTVVFFLCFLLESVKLEIGFALGLFAIFGIIRYRTNAIPIKEMTFLFVVIGISVINALASENISYAELFFSNLAVILLVWLMERIWMVNKEFSKIIYYENLELIKPEKEAELIKDIRERTGLDISRIEVGRIDFQRNIARIRIYFRELDPGKNFEDESEE